MVARPVLMARLFPAARRLSLLALLMPLAACSLDPVEAELLTCEDPQIDTSEWQQVTSSVYRFRLPPAFAPGENTRWESGRVWVEPQVLLSSDRDTEPLERLVDFHECRAVVAGREMLLQYGVTTLGGQFGPGIYMAANWGEIVQPPPPQGSGQRAVVIMEAWTPSETDFEVLWGIFWSMVITASS